MANTRTQILDIAERLIRTGGYNNCSFREIAAEIGIKSASVHHHFATKEDLAIMVAKRYSERFFLALGDPKSPPKPRKKHVERYCKVFQHAYASSGRACLCGVLAGEAGLLPERLQDELGKFIDGNVRWLENALATSGTSGRKSDLRAHALHIYSALQGAMGVAALRKDEKWLKDVSARLAAETEESS
jgi:TetR/AcrR family transcriptional regulator, transcriptional repressor for nem operon